MISLSAFWEGAAQRIDRAVFQEDSRNTWTCCSRNKAEKQDTRTCSVDCHVQTTTRRRKLMVHSTTINSNVHAGHALLVAL